MADEVGTGSEGGQGKVESPPPAPQPERGGAGEEPRARLRELAERLGRSRPKQLLVEYLQLRRSLM